MVALALNDTVKIQISASAVTTPSYDTADLHGPVHGLVDIDHDLVRQIVDRAGFYEGIIQQDDLERFDSTEVTFTVYMNGTTKALLGHEGDFFYLEHKLFEGTSRLVTYQLDCVIIAAKPGKDSDGRNIIQFRAKLEDYDVNVA